MSTITCQINVLLFDIDDGRTLLDALNAIFVVSNQHKHVNINKDDVKKEKIEYKYDEEEKKYDNKY